jgi:putative methyltransferase (TIGR04325 family)
MKQQQDDNKLMIIKKAKIYFIYKVLRKLLQIKTHTDLLFLVDKSIGKSDNLKILDIGGGVGENYFELLPINLKKVSFYVSDSYQLFKQGHKFRYNNIRSEDKIIYTGKISKHKFQFDLLLLNGSIQYLKDIAIIINQLAKKPKNIIIDRTLFSNNSFAAMQTNKGGYTTRYEIFLESRLIIKIESLGYEFSQGGSKRNHKIKFDVGTIDGYYKAMHFRIKSKQ